MIAINAPIPEGVDLSCSCLIWKMIACVMFSAAVAGWCGILMWKRRAEDAINFGVDWKR